MKYIIMCGGHYTKWTKPRQLTEVNGETIVARTIRLLKESGIKDICISSNIDGFEDLGVPVLKHENDYEAVEYNNSKGQWCSAFYLTDEPVCYMFGDVIFTPEAVKKIVEYETEDIMLFGSKEPFAPDYPKPYIEPFAFKVQDTEHLKKAVEEVRLIDERGGFFRRPIAWEVWNVICGTDPNVINDSYAAINDTTCDIDYPEEIQKVIR